MTISLKLPISVIPKLILACPTIYVTRCCIAMHYLGNDKIIAFYAKKLMRQAGLSNFYPMPLPCRIKR